MTELSTVPNNANPLSLEEASDRYGIAEEVLATLAMIGWIPGTKLGTGSRTGGGRWFFFNDQIDQGIRDMASKGRHCPTVQHARRLRAEWRHEHADEGLDDDADDEAPAEAQSAEVAS